jgi:hypothetical protein
MAFLFILPTVWFNLIIGTNNKCKLLSAVTPATHPHTATIHCVTIHTTIVPWTNATHPQFTV